MMSIRNVLECFKYALNRTSYVTNEAFFIEILYSSWNILFYNSLHILMLSEPSVLYWNSYVKHIQILNFHIKYLQRSHFTKGCRKPYYKKPQPKKIHAIAYTLLYDEMSIHNSVRVNWGYFCELLKFNTTLKVTPV